jgi:endonuclease YncB( thermonuclease family)
VKLRARCLVALTAFLLAAPAAAQKVDIVDGGTMHVDGTLYRLWGIAAPEPAQLCDDGWPIGNEAIRALARLMTGRRAVVCVGRERDQRGVMMAICKADNDDLGAAMVRDGMAWADKYYSDDYVDLERDARYERRGRHDHSCELPQSIQNRTLPNPRRKP